MVRSNKYLEDLLNSAVESLNFRLWGYELINRDRQSVLRMYIDTLNHSPIEAPSQITLEDCGLISRQVSALLDTEDVFSEPYCLEVSSPGERRPLLNLMHYRSVVGKRVHIHLSEPVLGQRQYKGKVLAVELDTIILDVNDKLLSIPYLMISRGNMASVC